MSRRFALVVALLMFGSLTASSPADAAVKKSGHLRYVTATVAGSEADAQASVPCPEGTEVIGGGAKLSKSAPTVVRLRASDIEESTNSGFGAASYLFTGDPKPVSMKAFAICTDAFDVDIVTSSTTVNFMGGTHSVGCPAENLLIGGGGSMSEGFATLNWTYSGDTWSVKGTADSSSSLRASAACSTGFDDAGFTRVNGIAPDDEDKIVDPGESKTVVAKCPPGTRVATGGWSSFTGGVRVRSSYPWDGKDRDTTPDDGWAVGYSNPDVVAGSGNAIARCHGKA